MSIVIPASGNLDQPTSLLLPNTAVNDVLTRAAASKDTTTVVGICIVNVDTVARLVTVWWTKDVTDYAIFQQSVPASSTVTVALDAPLKLFAKVTARKIKAQAAAANVVTVTVFSTSSQQQAENAG